MGPANYLTEMNNLAKFMENPSRTSNQGVHAREKVRENIFFQGQEIVREF